MDSNLKFNPSTTQAFLASLVRIAIILVAGSTTLIGVLRKADLNALYAYIQSSDFNVVLGALTTLVTIGYSLYTKVKDRKALAAAEPFAPNLQVKK